jgi:hypothetical protein
MLLPTAQQMRISASESAVLNNQMCCLSSIAQLPLTTQLQNHDRLEESTHLFFHQLQNSESGGEKNSTITMSNDLTKGENGGDKLVRKARKSPLAKTISKVLKKGMSYSIPLLRYSIIPGMLFFSVYFTKPTPTFLELLNPFF